MALTPLEVLRRLDAVVLAVPHRAYLEAGEAGIGAMLGPAGIVIDVKSALDPARLPAGQGYWSL